MGSIVSVVARIARVRRPPCGGRAAAERRGRARKVLERSSLGLRLAPQGPERAKHRDAGPNPIRVKHRCFPFQTTRAMHALEHHALCAVMSSRFWPTFTKF